MPKKKSFLKIVHMLILLSVPFSLILVGILFSILLFQEGNITGWIYNSIIFVMAILYLPVVQILSNLLKKLTRINEFPRSLAIISNFLIVIFFYYVNVFVAMPLLLINTILLFVYIIALIVDKKVINKADDYKILVVFFVVIGALLVIIFSNPLMQSEDKIKKDVLKSTPIGTSTEDVLNFIESNKQWKIIWISDIPRKDTNLSSNRIRGAKSIKAYAGGYRIIFEADVEVYWGFDENDKLIEVGIRKTFNSL